MKALLLEKRPEWTRWTPSGRAPQVAAAVNLEEEFTDSLAVAPLIEDARSIISRRHKQNPKFQVSQAMLVKGGAKK